MKTHTQKTPNGKTLEALGTDSDCRRSKGERGATKTQGLRKTEGKRERDLRRGQEACEGDTGV